MNQKSRFTAELRLALYEAGYNVPEKALRNCVDSAFRLAPAPETAELQERVACLQETVDYFGGLIARAERRAAGLTAVLQGKL